MYKYDFYLRDYRSKAGHLDLLHHGAYKALLDAYYDSEAPLPGNPAGCFRLAVAFTQEEKTAVEDVLKEFFKLGRDGRYHNKMADEQIDKYRQFVELQREKGKKGGRPHKADGLTNGFPTANPQGNPNESLSPTPSPTPSSTQTPTPTKNKRTMSDVRPSDAAVRLSIFMLDTLRQRLPDLRQPNMSAWEKDFDKMLRLDGRIEDSARELIGWMEEDMAIPKGFHWGSVILSPAKLREKWDQIQAQRRGNGSVCTPTQRDKYAHLEEA
jgi:uncharacterized protein YdaU (DUF1376 family)